METFRKREEEMVEKESILIVDDDEGTCSSLALIFNRTGYVTETAGTGREAIEKAKGRFFNVTLLDINLPDMDGVKLIAPLKEINPDMVVILITGHASLETAARAVKEEAEGYIIKPLDMDEVLVSVREAIEKQCLVMENRRLYQAAQQELAERKRAEEALQQTVEQLKIANQKILEQQKAVIEEERLKVLIQMAGATAHELNQPLTALLSNIELIDIDKDNTEKSVKLMADIKEAGQRISCIVKKIQNIRHDETRPYPYIREQTITDLDQKVIILAVEDLDEDFETLKAILKPHDQINLSRARDIEEAMEVSGRTQFDLILLDYLLPDGDGLDFLGRMEKEIPVVVITGNGDEMIASQVIQAGAYDYIPKDRVSDKSLSRIIMNTLEKARLKREMKEAQKKIAEMSTRDELTGLYNRRYFVETLEREIASAKRYGTDLVLCMADLDHFKEINDTYGHPAGDMVLSEIGSMLKECIRQSDLVCRYGGEEFAVILPNTDAEKARAVSERFRNRVAKHDFKHKSSHFGITVSIGVALYNNEVDKSPMEFVEMADRALYQAKEAGRNRVVVDKR
ncbi:MAG: diguanylate cyclase [Desulfobacterales bacterium]|nr:diguanylate cyclase [Desulfobacterales bacterium]